MSVFIGSTTPAQRKCLDKEFHKLYSKKKAFMPRKQKIAIALNTCDVGIKGVKKEEKDRFEVAKKVKGGLLYGYYIYDNKKHVPTGFEFSEDELYKAKSKAELMNILNKDK